MGEVLTKILITSAADTNQQLLFKYVFTHSQTVFCPFPALQLRHKEIGLFLAKTGPKLLLDVDSLTPITVLANKKIIKKIQVSIRFKTGQRHSIL
jgi:hypothetical protein